jgi:hypothetical protein
VFKHDLINKLKNIEIAKKHLDSQVISTQEVCETCDEAARMLESCEQVVHCKDCIHYDEHGYCKRVRQVSKGMVYYKIEVSDNDFCSAGEKRNRY